MSWLDTITEISRLGGITGAATSYIRGVIISTAVGQGASANSILSALSANGLGIRREQGLQLVSAEKQRQAAGQTASRLGLNTPSSQLLDTVPPENWTGQYIHQVTATYRTRDEEGNYILHTRTLGLKSATALTPADAVAAAQQIMSSEVPAEEEGNYPLPSDVLSMELSGVWYDVQNRNLPTVGSSFGGG